MDADLDGAADWMDTREQLLKWAAQSERFQAYENREGKKERYPMFHIVSPGELMADNISIEDLYLPIEIR